MVKEILIIYTDASYRMSTDDGSYGYIILRNDIIDFQFCKATQEKKINVLEFTSIYYALKTVLTKYLQRGLFIDEIEVFTDSMNCIKYINNEYKLKNEYLKEIKKNIDLVIEDIKKTYDCKINIYHVKSHDNCKLNNLIDNIVQSISLYNRDKKRGFDETRKKTRKNKTKN